MFWHRRLFVGSLNTKSRRSIDLKDVFPDIKSFSTTNLKYMRYFYEMYPLALENSPQLGDDLVEPEYHKQETDGYMDITNRPQVGDDL